MRRFWLFSLVSLVWIFPVFVFAQTSISLPSGIGSLGTGGLSVVMSPQYPSPGQTVSFSAEDYSDNLTNSTLTWEINGKTNQSGTGDTQFQTFAPASGTSEMVSLSVTTTSGTTLQKSISFTSESVDMLWQAHSYVPPFYEGKALFPYQGTVTITAMPSFNLNAPQKVVYKWSLDGSPLSTVSGYGQNTISLTGSILLKPINLSVVATSQDGNLVAENSITLNSTEPTVLLYQDNALYGMLLNEAVGSNNTSFNIGAGQISVRAVPYFVDAATPFSQDADFSWSMNDQTIANQTSSVLTVASPAGQTGNSTVAVNVTDPDSTFQTGSASVNVSFSSTNQQP